MTSRGNQIAGLGARFRLDYEQAKQAELSTQFIKSYMLISFMTLKLDCGDLLGSLILNQLDCNLSEKQ